MTTANITAAATTTKAVGYAYPTSIAATKLGYARSGCWTVSTAKNDGPHKNYLAGFATKEEAIEYANSFILPWSRWTHR